MILTYFRCWRQNDLVFHLLSPAIMFDQQKTMKNIGFFILLTKIQVSLYISFLYFFDKIWSHQHFVIIQITVHKTNSSTTTWWCGIPTKGELRVKGKQKTCSIIIPNGFWRDHFTLLCMNITLNKLVIVWVKNLTIQPSSPFLPPIVRCIEKSSPLISCILVSQAVNLDGGK